MEQKELVKIDRRIRAIRKAAEELKKGYSEVPAIDRNVARILASVKMLELNVSDLLA